MGRLRTSSLVAQVQRLALSCLAGDLAHGPGVRVSMCSQSGREALRAESQVGAQGAQIEVKRRRSMPDPGKGDDFSRTGCQSRSRIVRLINMGLPGARVVCGGDVARYGSQVLRGVKSGFKYVAG